MFRGPEPQASWAPEASLAQDMCTGLPGAFSSSPVGPHSLLKGASLCSVRQGRAAGDGAGQAPAEGREEDQRSRSRRETRLPLGQLRRGARVCPRYREGGHKTFAERAPNLGDSDPHFAFNHPQLKS